MGVEWLDPLGADVFDDDAVYTVWKCYGEDDWSVLHEGIFYSNARTIFEDAKEADPGARIKFTKQLAEQVGF